MYVEGEIIWHRKGWWGGGGGEILEREGKIMQSTSHQQWCKVCNKSLSGFLCTNILLRLE